MSTSNRRQVRVGVFVTLLLLAVAASIFVLGGSTDLLEDRYTLNGAWEDVAGLQEGSIVELAGIQVGEVSAIRVSDDLGVKEIFVEMKLMSRYQERIRQDSEARIDTVGVLGDKKVAISFGSKEQPILEDDAWIATRPALDLLAYTANATEILNNAQSISRKVDLMLGSDEQAAQASVAESMNHIEAMLHEAKEGKGLLHALVYDEGMTRKVDKTLTNLEAMSESLRGVSEEVQHGDGLANELIYGKVGAALAVELRQLAGSLREITTDIKTEDSLLHALIYDPQKAQVIDDIADSMAALKVTTEAISNGEGTIGMLSRDPALYEDLRSLVGGAQRNKLLRAYIRQTVQRGDAENASPWEPAQ